MSDNADLGLQPAVHPKKAHKVQPPRGIHQIQTPTHLPD